MRPIQVVLDVLPANTQSVSVQAENAPASNAVALAQTLADGGSLTIDGTFAADGVATFPVPSRIMLSSADDFYGTTFDILGTDADGNAIHAPIYGGPNDGFVIGDTYFATVTAINSNASGYTTETISAGAYDFQDFALDGIYATDGVVTFPYPTRVSMTDTLGTFEFDTFSITGTDAYGNVISEQLAGPIENTIYSTLVYATVTQVLMLTPDYGDYGFSIGNEGLNDGPTAWWPLDIYTPNQVTNTSCKLLSGDLTYSVQYTNEDPFNSSITQLVVAHPSGLMTDATTSKTAPTKTLMRAVRFNFTAGVGTARVTVVQQSTR